MLNKRNCTLVESPYCDGPALLNLLYGYPLPGIPIRYPYRLYPYDISYRVYPYSTDDLVIQMIVKLPPPSPTPLPFSKSKSSGNIRHFFLHKVNALNQARLQIAAISCSLRLGIRAVYKSGTGTRGRGHRDVRRGT